MLPTLVYHAPDITGQVWSCADRTRLAEYVRGRNLLLSSIAGVMPVPYLGTPEPDAKPLPRREPA